MNRRNFLMTTAAVAAMQARAAKFELDEITIDQLQEGMRAGRFTARTLVEKYLARIDAIDKKGPAINAVIELNPEALAIADALDRERKAKGARGPLHGIPILVKDNIDTGDRMTTTAGSLALEGSRAARDAAVAARLRAAGAVILGKTNLSEWANFRSTHSVSGWSGRGGQTKNPYALDRNPCGSSSGSGAAAAANLCAAAVGTETDGSVVCPSSMCGIVGIKPTVGLLGGAGIVPISHTQDTAGPMARTVRDAAILLGAMASTDKQQRDYTKYLDRAGLRGARIGIARKFFGFNTAVDRLMEECIAVLKREGAEIVDPADLPSHGKWGEPEMEVLLYEFKADLTAFLAARPGARVRSLADVIAFNEKNAAREMPYFAQEIMVNAQKKGPLTEKAYLDALALCRKLSRAEGIDAVTANYKVQAIVAPTTGPAWVTDWLNGDHDTGGCSTPAAVAGYPHITVPAGFVHGMPVGISFFGPAWSEPALVKIAYAFEQARQARRPPEFLPTVRFEKA
jgi:amidase